MKVICPKDRHSMGCCEPYICVHMLPHERDSSCQAPILRKIQRERISGGGKWGAFRAHCPNKCVGCNTLDGKKQIPKAWTIAFKRGWKNGT